MSANKSNNISYVAEGHLCSGCGTCNSICPTNAITMEISPLGALLPIVNDDKCVSCKKCLVVCPGVDLSGEIMPGPKGVMGDIISSYVGKSNDSEIFHNAQSGGLVTEILSFLFEEGEIDAALVVGQDELRAHYFIVTDRNDLKKSQLSQYTPVDLNSGLSKIASYSSIAVVGLPCHIEGIKKTQNHYPKQLSNIKYLFGLVCGGTLSNAIAEIVCSGCEQVERIDWRSKKYSNYRNAKVALLSSSWSKPKLVDRNIRMAAKYFLTPPRCRVCWDKMNVFADIVFADVWGVDNTDKKGETVMLIRTEIGSRLIARIKKSNRISIRACSTSDIENGQGIDRRVSQVKKSISIYKDKSWPTPGWVNSPLFAGPKENADSLKIEIEDFVKNDSLDKIEAINYVTKRIRNKARTLYFKDLIKGLKFIIINHIG